MEHRLMKRTSALAVSVLTILAGPAGCDDDGNTAVADASIKGTAGDAGQHSGPDEEMGCDTTWAAIQKTILQKRGCTASACHRSDTPTGMLDLSGDVAWDNMINVQSQAAIDMPIITPGEEKLSLLYVKLAAKTNNVDLPTGAGGPMPTAGNALNADELAALRLWIRAGAPLGTVVDGTQALLACEQPQDADPNKIPRPPVPAKDVGFQNYAGPWDLKSGSEAEVCFATYYDLTDSAPDWAKVDCGADDPDNTCVTVDRHQLTQDAQSHHGIVFLYTGPTSPLDGGWGPWQCGGGDQAGTVCDPTQPRVSVTKGGGDCGERAVCQTPITDKKACLGFGPKDFPTNRVVMGGAQTPVSTIDYSDGVYSRLPIKSVVVWNSHAFNLTDKDTTIEQYHNFRYARPENRDYEVQSIFDIRHVFVMSVPPFESREYCASYEVPQYSRVSMLTSHVHKRGVLYRTWMPPNEVDCEPSDCMPNDGEPDYVSRLYNDPTVMQLDPPLVLDDPEPESRSFKYCAVFDNGDKDPSTVRRATGNPKGAAPCTPTHCVGGSAEGSECSKDDDCAGDGVCDACTLLGGFTTEDEMLEFQGLYWLQPPAGESTSNE